VERIRQAFQRSPKKSTRRASAELQLPQPTVWKVMRKRLHMTPYRLQLLQKLKPGDNDARHSFCSSMQEKLEEDGFWERLVFSDEATFHVNGKVNRRNVRIWGTENPHACLEHERDSPKVNVFCAISIQKVYGPFFFVEDTVNANRYLDMVQQWLMPQLQEDSDSFVFQQDGAPPHYGLAVREYLNEDLPQRWIGRTGPDDEALLRWPPRSPDLTPCDFFLWGYVKGLVYVPPVPISIDELKIRIRQAVETVTVDMLYRVWGELDYRLDICRVTRGAHIEHL
jgi:hypothetical protein